MDLPGKTAAECWNWTGSGLQPEGIKAVFFQGTMTQKRSLLYCTLLPEYFGRRHEDRNLEHLLSSFRSGVDLRFELSLLLGSAHKEVLHRAGRIAARYNIIHELLHIPFENRPDFNERRAHEISHCKQVLSGRIRDKDVDIVAHIDSDIQISFNDLAAVSEALSDNNSFGNIPYVIHDALTTPSIQFGAHVHHHSLFKTIDYVKDVYRQTVRNGRIHRVGAPDCAVRQRLLRSGGREIRATPDRVMVSTRHYSDDGSYGLYDRGRMSRHWDADGRLTFDPIKDNMAMELDSCLAVADFCRRSKVHTAVDLGTGSGNSLRSLLDGGVSRVVSVDEDERWTHRHASFTPASNQAVIFVTRSLISHCGARAYDLREFKDELFDVVVVDGPQLNPRGRIASVLQLTAKNYLFHDGIRDRKLILELHDQLERLGRHYSLTESLRGRGMTMLSAT